MQESPNIGSIINMADAAGHEIIIVDVRLRTNGSNNSQHCCANNANPKPEVNNFSRKEEKLGQYSK